MSQNASPESKVKSQKSKAQNVSARRRTCLRRQASASCGAQRVRAKIKVTMRIYGKYNK